MSDLPLTEKIYIYIQRHPGVTKDDIVNQFKNQCSGSGAVRADLGGMVEGNRVIEKDGKYTASSKIYQKASNSKWGDIATYLL